MNNLYVLSTSPSNPLAGLYTGPYFAPSLGSSTNITVREGETAHLSCKVRQVGTYTVSWVRTKDSRILAIEEDRVVPDNRYYAYKEKRREE